jgi:Outer membrane protein beta-barrel domain
MKIRIIYAFCVLVLAQTSVAAQSRISVGITAAPVVNYSNIRQHILLPDYTNPGGQPIDNVLGSRSTTGGYVVGTSIQYNFTPAWSIASGFWLYQTRRTGTFPFTPGNLPSRIISNTFQVPLLLNYRSGTRRLSPYFSVGVVGSSNRSTLFKPVEGTAFSKTRVVFNRKAVTIQALVGAGVAYRITPHVSVTVQPLLIWHFRPSGNYDHYTAYQVNGQTQLLYTF